MQFLESTNQITIFFKKFLICFSLFLFDQISFANESYKTSSKFLGVEVVRNSPTFYSTQRFSTGNPHLGLNYKFRRDDTYLLGVGGHLSFLFDKDKKESFPIVNVFQESSYLFRLYYPSFISVGSRLHYLYPIQKGMLPFRKHEEFEIELGVGIVCQILYLSDKGANWGLSFERWRGTGSMVLHGFEISLQWIYALN